MTTVSCKRKVRVWVEVIVNRGAALYGESSLFTQNRGPGRTLNKYNILLGLYYFLNM